MGGGVSRVLSPKSEAKGIDFATTLSPTLSEPRNEFSKYQATASTEKTDRPLHLCGVELEYLIRMSAELESGMFARNQFFTTEEMCRLFIRPRVKEKMCRFVDTVPHWHVKEAEVMVVHAWRAPFKSLVQSLRRHFNYDEGGEAAKGISLWLDFFAVNQTPGRLHTADMEEMEDVVAHTHLSLLVLDMHTIALTRTWCLYEMWMAITTRGAESLQVVVWHELKDIFRDIDLDQSQCSCVEERSWLLERMLEGGREPREIDHILKDAIVESMRVDIQVIMQEGSKSERRHAKHTHAHMLLLKGDGDGAYHAHKEALMIAEERYGRDHPAVTTSLIHLAETLTDLERYPEAERLYERVLATRQHMLGPEHSQVAKSMDDLGYVLLKQKKFADAEVWYMQALAIYEQLYDEWHHVIATCFDHIADLYTSQERWEEMAPMCLRSAAIWENMLGEMHPNVANAVANEALARTKLGEFEEARPLYERCIRIREEVFGGNHMDVAQSLNNLAFMLMEVNEDEEAEALFHRSVVIRQHVQGPEHPDVATGYSNMAVLFRKMNRLDEAVAMLERAVEIMMSAFGPDSLAIATTYNNLSSLMVVCNRLEEALELDRKSLEVRELCLGQDHPDTNDARVMLAKTHLSLGNTDLALQIYQDALQSYETALGPENMKVAETLTAMSQIYCSQSPGPDLESGLMLQQTALEITAALHPPTHPALATHASNLADVLAKMSRVDEAAEMYNQAIEVCSLAFGDDSVKVAVQKRKLGKLRHQNKQLQQAHDIYLQVLGILEGQFGPDHPGVAVSLNDLSQCLMELGRSEEAIQRVTRHTRVVERLFGLRDPRTGAALTAFGDRLHQGGMRAKAEEQYLKALEIFSEASESEGGEVSWGQLGCAHAGLARLFVDKQLWDQAQAKFKEAASCLERIRGADHTDAVRVRLELAALFASLGQNHFPSLEAEMWKLLLVTSGGWGNTAERQASAQKIAELAVLLDQRGGDHPSFKSMLAVLDGNEVDSPELLTVVRNVVARHKAEKDLPSAAMLLERLLALQEKFSKNSKCVKDTVNDLSYVLQCLDKGDEARALQNRLPSILGIISSSVGFKSRPGSARPRSARHPAVRPQSSRHLKDTVEIHMELEL